jgi:hypothetical protein
MAPTERTGGVGRITFAGIMLVVSGNVLVRTTGVVVAARSMVVNFLARPLDLCGRSRFSPLTCWPLEHRQGG